MIGLDTFFWKNVAYRSVSKSVKIDKVNNAITELNGQMEVKTPLRTNSRVNNFLF